MLAGRLVRLIEKNSEKLARELSEKVWNSPRCSDLRKVPPDELQARTREIYQNLNNWLMDMTETEIERRYTENLEAYDLFLQARERYWRRTREGVAQARTTLERAITLDPTFAAAHALLAEIYRSEWWFGWREEEHALDRALELARKGVALDDSLPPSR